MNISRPPSLRTRNDKSGSDQSPIPLYDSSKPPTCSNTSLRYDMLQASRNSTSPSYRHDSSQAPVVQAPDLVKWPGRAALRPRKSASYNSLIFFHLNRSRSFLYLSVITEGPDTPKTSLDANALTMDLSQFSVVTTSSSINTRYSPLAFLA